MLHLKTSRVHTFSHCKFGADDSNIHTHTRYRCRTNIPYRRRFTSMYAQSRWMKWMDGKQCIACGGHIMTTTTPTRTVQQWVHNAICTKRNGVKWSEMKLKLKSKVLLSFSCIFTAARLLDLLHSDATICLSSNRNLMILKIEITPKIQTIRTDKQMCVRAHLCIVTVYGKILNEEIISLALIWFDLFSLISLTN